ncbi:uncharacterized protein [Gossypium hirsutum]|uniref:Uncharacterized protein LOC107926904 isoform X2 n=1 Tax=Gossypium hirsutum TaxID=3635 RepID=A0A1U8LFD8_GOSHI|nr:uncharacterized protein LOC107926904 isoform X2 [Gossypium hirsutum]XP_040930840.1 uncharacterized protein LOC107926904 isoform X2 [Gossypium hirsutum]
MLMVLIMLVFTSSRMSLESTIRDALSLIQAVAMAAERRLQDDIWCGSHCSDIAGDEKSCADTLQDHLDLDQGGERLSICGVGVLIMHFIESTISPNMQALQHGKA